MQNLDKEIQAAFEIPNPELAVKELESILENIYSNKDNAEAKVRRLAYKLPPVKLAEEPDWLPGKIEDLIQSKIIGQSHLHCLQATSNLIRAFLAAVPSVKEPEMYINPSQAIEVWWNPDLIWLLYPTELFWPTLNVRVYSYTDKLCARSFWSAQSAIEYSVKVLNNI